LRDEQSRAVFSQIADLFVGIDIDHDRADRHADR